MYGLKGLAEELKNDICGGDQNNFKKTESGQANQFIFNVRHRTDVKKHFH